MKAIELIKKQILREWKYSEKEVLGGE